MATITFITSGNWTVPLGVVSILVEAIGQGGNGADGTNSNGGGGGGGAGYAASTISVNRDQIYTISVNTTRNSIFFDVDTITPLVLAEGGFDGNSSCFDLDCTGSGGFNGGAGSIGSVLNDGGGGANVPPFSGGAGPSGGGGGGAGGSTSYGSSPALCQWFSCVGGLGGGGDAGNGGDGGDFNTVGGAGNNYGGGGGGGAYSEPTPTKGGIGGPGIVRLTFTQLNENEIPCGIYKVHVNRTGEQGQLDLDPSTGETMQPSKQRTMYNTGKNLTYREHPDGRLFTDCDYWDRFTVPSLPPAVAFVDIINKPQPQYVYSDYAVLTTDTFAINYINIECGYSKFTQIRNNGTGDILVKINQDAGAVMLIKAGKTQVLPTIHVTNLAFQGGASDASLEIILSIVRNCVT